MILYKNLYTMKAKILIPLLLLLLMGKGYAQAGDGKSKSNPLSVAQAIDKEGDKEYYWVKGYIVGYINKNLANTVFGVGATKTNVILADDSTCTDKSKILPVELPTGSLRNALNLADHPENLHRLVVVNGKPETYFSTPGIKSTGAYEFLDDRGDGGVVKPDTVIIIRNDTIYQEVLVHDTVYQEVERHDTVYQEVVHCDTIYQDVLVHDTIYETVTQTDTIRTYLPIVDTCYVQTVVVKEVVDTLLMGAMDEVPAPTIVFDGKKITLVSGVEGTTLFYTLDGSEPMPFVSPCYTEPIAVAESCTVRAVAVLLSGESRREVDTSVPYLVTKAASRRVYGLDGMVVSSAAASEIVVTVTTMDDGTQVVEKRLISND